MKKLGLILLAASPLAGCATMSFAPPGVQVKYVDDSGSALTCADTRRSQVDRTITVERSVTGALRVSTLSDRSGFDLYENAFPVDVGDTLILNTDGFYGVLKKSDLVAMNTDFKDLAEFCVAAKDRISMAGPIDDYSAVFIRS